jgi:hypothetical protein
MKASIQWLCEKDGIIRIHPDEPEDGDIYDYRHPYDWALTVEKRGDQLWMMGMCKKPSISHGHALKVLYAALNLKPKWERIFTKLDRETGVALS